jgi:hypothetical protein
VIILKKPMVKQLLSALIVTILLASCSSLKPLNFTSSKQVVSTGAINNTREPKFIEEIAVTPQTSNVSTKEIPTQTYTTRGFNIEETAEANVNKRSLADRMSGSSIESVSKVQLKYAILLNSEVEFLPNKVLLETVDEWYGVRYRTGGNTKSGVDCSGFSVAVYAAVYGITLPRVSREQYRTSRHISTTELQEGDMVFFDTRGRGTVSHVGIYLGNNKFIHASVSKGVMVSSLFDPYYLNKFVGGGRIDNKSIASITY